MTRSQSIYMDYAASTPMDVRVKEKMLPFFGEAFGNPHSTTHPFGWAAKEAIEEARKNIAGLINADPSEIIFTSGATESNNLAIKGAAGFYGGEKNHIITVSTEHKCVLDTCRSLSQEGWEITYLTVSKDGLINLEELESCITDKTLMVSIMAINNEIGVIQPLKEIGEICKKKGVLFHSDAAQAFGKVPLDVKEMKIDLLSISGHKIYGPQGIGALYVGKKPTRVRLKPLFSGGDQERGMRPGTVPTALAAGLGAAAEIAEKEMKENYEYISRLSSKLVSFLQSLPEVHINGSLTKRYPGCINASFSCIEGESMMGAMKSIALSSGSACTSASLEPSYVLKAIGVDVALAHTSIRFSIGKFTTEEEIDYVIERLGHSVKKLRDLSPLWDMIQSGIDINSIKWAGHGHK